MSAMSIDRAPIDIRDHDFFIIDRAFGNDLAVRSANKTLTPELNACSTGRRFMTDAIGDSNITTVRDGVTALDRFPSRMLRFAKLLFLAGMPADGGWIEQNFGAAQRGQSCSFGVPLVPANAHADFSALRFPRLKSEIAGREIKFLVVKRIVGNVHLAIFSKKFPVGIDDGSGVMINAGAPLFEKRRDDDDAQFAP